MDEQLFQAMTDRFELLVDDAWSRCEDADHDYVQEARNELEFEYGSVFTQWYAERQRRLAGF